MTGRSDPPPPSVDPGASAPDPPFVTPAFVGRYRLGRLLGEGGAARVFAAEDERGNAFAVKLLRSTVTANPEHHQRLLREAEAVRSIEHPGVVRVHETGTTPDGYPYLVMDYIDGESLRQRLARGPVDPAEAWRIVRAAADVIGAAHARGLLHRDLTPGNLLIDRGKRVLLTDFGLVRQEGAAPMTRVGDALGTPDYMAPEQWWGTAVDVRTDLYGLGVILYEALSGRTPWQGGDAGEVLHRIATEEPPSIRERLPGVDPGIDVFLRRCLARVADRRPPDVAAFLAEGDEVFGWTGTTAGGGLRRWLGPAAAGLAVLGSLVLMGYRGTRDPGEWWHLGGFFVFLGPATALLGLPALRWVYGRVVVPALPLLVGGLGTWFGFYSTMRGVRQTTLEDRFLIFHIGLSELSANLFVGGGVSAALCTALAWRALDRGRPGWREAFFAGSALIAAGLSGNAGAMAVGLLAAALILLRRPTSSPGGACAGLAAVAALIGVATARQLAAHMGAWSLPRAQRTVALTEVGGEWTALWAAVAFACVAVATSMPWRRLREIDRGLRLAGTAMALLCALSLTLLGRSIVRERQALWLELAPRFSLWSELTPPDGAGSARARVGPTLQIGRRVIAVDGATVAPRQALETSGSAGSMLVAQALATRVLPGGAGPDLVLACDRTVSWAGVARALGAARELGVTRVDVLLLPGPQPPPHPSMPPEAAFVLPDDLRRVEVTLAPGGDGEALHPGPEASFAEVAARLATMGSPRLALE